MMVARIQKKNVTEANFHTKTSIIFFPLDEVDTMSNSRTSSALLLMKVPTCSEFELRRISVFNAFNLKSWFKLHLKWAAFLLLIRGKSVFPKSSALESWNWVFWSMSVAVFSFFSDEISEWFWDVKNIHHQFWTRSYENRSNWIIQALFDPSFLRHHIYLRIMRAYNVQLKQMSLFHRI